MWADIVCPWCYLGNVRLKKAIAQLDEPSAAEVRTRSFQLDPFATEVPRSNLEYLSEKFAVSEEDALAMDARLAALCEAEGVPFATRRPTANSFNLHRAVWLAREYDAGEALFDKLQFALFRDGADVFGVERLVADSVELGVPEDRVREVLGGKEYGDEVRGDIAEAEAIGITGVPFLVLDRKYAIPGAASVEQYYGVLTGSVGPAPG